MMRAARIVRCSGMPRVTAFCGLGAMGYPMAGNLAKKIDGQNQKMLVWNRTKAKADQHASEFGSTAVDNLADLAAADVVLMCLPTSNQDATIAQELAPHLREGTCILSCTSGDPVVVKELAKSMLENYGIHFMDAPVSGGPRGAAAATIACMFGADNDEAAERCERVLQKFSKKVVRTGPAGSACAVKAINNVMNSTHLLVAAEGLLALQKLGVKPDVALSAINGSSGRSLQTQERVPNEVMTRNFAYGFKLPLMAKDCRIAESVLDAGFPQAQLLRAGSKLVNEAESTQSENADYSRIVCLLEERAGHQLKRSSADSMLQKNSKPVPQISTISIYPDVEKEASRHGFPNILGIGMVAFAMGSIVYGDSNLVSAEGPRASASH